MKNKISLSKQLLFSSLTIIALFLFFGVIKFIQISRVIAENSNFKPPPEAVTSVIAAESEWDLSYRAVGTLMPSEGTTLSTESAGRVAKINFDSGMKIESGTVLIELDSTVEEGELKAAEATLNQTKDSWERAKGLKAKGAISQSDYEDALAKNRQAEAAVMSMRAMLARRKILAPFAGFAGIRMVNLGQYLMQGSLVVPLQKLDPLFVNFSLPQKLIDKLQVGLKIKVTVDAFNDASFEGVLTSIDPQVDMNSRNINLQATIQNLDHKLKPGMFSNVELILPEKTRVIAIPNSAINYSPSGDTVFIVEKQKDPQGQEYKGVRQQLVKLGYQRGDLISILEGIKIGEEVVTTGTFKLRPNAEVAVNNAYAPKGDLKPNPEDT